ncbi:MAG TPA: YetF domain-containing protein [Pyrinomonadaceae bacterium]|jgi:uncharacterized membrane protein YcaP (DUF421 family)
MESAKFFFDNWSKLGRSLILAVLAYAILVFLLRISGKRTLTKMNVFDFVFVVALGSTLATTILSTDVTLADGVLAFVALMALQILLSWLCVKSHWLDSIVNGEPALLVHKGRFLTETMQRERVTKEEVFAAVRNMGLLTLDEIDSVVLETDGRLSVVWNKTQGATSSLADVPGHPSEVPDEEKSNQHTA